MRAKYQVGDRMIAHTTAEDHDVKLDGAIVTVSRILGSDEADIAEVGPMYEVTVVMQVFEDELSKS